MKEFPSNVVILGDPLSNDSFNAVLACLFRSQGTVYVYCNGGGGSGDAAFAIVDACRHRGNVAGILVGGAASAHGVVWAGMPDRYAMPLSTMDVHLGGIDDAMMKIDTVTAKQLAKAFENHDLRMASVFSEMGKYTPEWWYQTLQGVGSNYVESFSAEWLIENGLCKPSSALVMELEYEESD